MKMFKNPLKNYLIYIKMYAKQKKGKIYIIECVIFVQIKPQYCIKQLLCKNSKSK